MLNLFRYIGYRHLKLKPSRVLLTTLGVGFGIALYVAIAIINHSTKNSLRENIESISGKSKLTISSGPAGFDEAKLEIVRVVPGVKSAVPMIESRAFFQGATDSVQGLYVLGVDMLQESSVRNYKATDQRLLDDPLTFLNQPDSIVITQLLAQDRKLSIDSKIQLTTAIGLKTFTVRGILEPEGAAKAYGGSLAIMDIDGARMMFGKENKLDRIDIVPTAGFSTNQLKENLEKALGSGFTIQSPETESEQVETMLNSYQLILTFFSSLALLVGLFLVMNSISVSVAERKKEIGTLRALGATRLSMVLLFVTEIFFIGFFGSVLGCFIGRFLASKLVTQVTNSLAAQFQTQFNVTRLEFTQEQMIFSIALGTVAAIVAAFIPAAKAAKVHPLESMKRFAENTSEAEEKKNNLIAYFGLLMLIFMAASMYYNWGKSWVGIEIVTRGASVMGAALFGPFLVYGLIYLSRKLTQNLSMPVIKLAHENLVRSRKRTTANVMALMVGLFLVVLIASVRSSFHDTLTNWLDQMFVADMLVASNGRMITADVQLMKESLQEELLKVPGVRAIGENHGMSSRVVSIFYHGKRMTIKATDHYADFYDYRNFAVVGADRVETAKTLYETDEPRVLVTQNFLRKQHETVGNQITLNTPTGATSFKITGVITDYASPEGVFYMNRKIYKKYWQDALVTGFYVNAAPGYTVEQVRTNIDTAIGKKWNVVTISNAEFKEQMQGAVERTFAYTRAIEYIALFVGLLGLLNTLLISVMERTREIGMLRAVGTTRSQIQRVILTEAILQGLYGSVIAIGLGAFVGYMFVTYALSTSLGWIIQFYFPKDAILKTLATGTVVAMIAGLLPAYRAAKLNITEALDYE